MKVIFFGTPSFAGKILEYLIDNRVNIVAVVTQSDKRRGKVSFVKDVADRRLPNIRVFQPEKATDLAFIQDIKSYTPDLFVVVAFGKILRQSLLDLPSKGAINVHASILPKYRGAAPIQSALINGEKKTGVTIIMMSAGLDSGDIIATTEVPIDEKINFGQLQDNLCEVAKPLLLKVLKTFEMDKEIKKYPQDDKMATYAPKIVSEDLNIDFEKDALSIHNQIRAFSPLPGARCLMKVKDSLKRVKVLESEVVLLSGKPRELLRFERDDFIVACKKNAISIKKLQIEGKKIVSSSAFIRGIKNNIEIF